MKELRDTITSVYGVLNRVGAPGAPEQAAYLKMGYSKTLEEKSESLCIY
jgi:hypothetical protein